MTAEDQVAPGLVADSVVAFYRWWHGRLHLKGAGFLLDRLSHHVGGLQRYPLPVPGIGTVPVDFRDYTGRLWLQHLLGDRLADYDVEDGLARAIIGAIGEDAVVWDIGGSVGMVTAAVIKAIPSTTVVTVEPNPFLFQGLRRLFADHANVRVLPYAFSDQESEVVLTIPKGKSVGASINGIEYVLETSGLTAQDVDQVTVRAVSGDSLLAGDRQIPPPDVVKIDVEGHEAAALRGLAGVIARYRPTVFFEHLYLSDDVVRAVVPEGYTLHSVDNVTGALAAAFDRSVGHNSALVPRRNL